MNRKSSRQLLGKVVSISGDKTINVLIETYRRDPLYGKRVKRSKKYLVHDLKNQAKVGDKVAIMEVRPLSKRKHFKLVKIVEKAVLL